jgi:glycosyltransferase involved in cell wall biosynthesis
MAGLVVNLAFVGKKPTGLATYAINLVPNLDLPDITLLASQSFLPRLSPQAPYFEVPDNLTYEQGKLGHFRRMAWTQFQLPKLCARLQPDLLFSPVPELPLAFSYPAVVMVHDLIPLRFPRLTSPLTQYTRYYVPQVLRQVQHIICNSQATAQDLIDFFGISSAKITPIPLAHDAAHFRVIAASPASNEPPYFVYVGRHDPYKNLHRLINAFAALLKSFPGSSSPDYHLYIAGSADPRFTPTLQAQAAELGLSHRVKFLDYVTYDQLPLLLNQAIAMVYPSLWEGFGFPVLEAMACGTPVITSNLSSLPEVTGDAAILIDPFNAAELTAAMRQVMDTSTRAQLRAAGLARASRFSWAKTGQVTCDLLRRFL